MNLRFQSLQFGFPKRQLKQRLPLALALPGGEPDVVQNPRGGGQCSAKGGRENRIETGEDASAPIEYQIDGDNEKRLYRPDGYRRRRNPEGRRAARETQPLLPLHPSPEQIG